MHAVVPGERIEGGVDAARGEVVLRFRGRTVLAYAFAADQFKPYVRELYTLRGENVLRDAPADHLHHHGWMYAIRVNGVNFWEEQPPAGRQVGDEPPSLKLGTSRSGLPQAVLEHDLRWQPPGENGAGGALLRERRILTLTVDAGHEEVSVEWRSRFTIGPGAEKVALQGADYHGLGLRLPAEFDRVAEFSNSAGLPYSAEQTWDVRPADWTAVAGRLGGREVMVALAAHPANAGVSTFFTMRNAFAYLTATQSLGRESLEYGRGARFDLRYLLVAYPAHQNVNHLSARFAGWREAR